MRLKLILFDLDGVVLDSRRNMEIAWEAVRRDFPEVPTFEEYFANIGRSFDDIMRLLKLSEQAGTIEERYRQASAEHMDECTFFTGVVDILKEIKASGRFMGIITSKDSDRTAMVLERMGIDFDHVGTPTANLRGKPAPDHLLTVMPMAFADPAETIYVGDMPVDAEAAWRAGCHYAHASWGYGRVINPEILLDRPEDMLDWLRAA